MLLCTYIYIYSYLPPILNKSDHDRLEMIVTDGTNFEMEYFFTKYQWTILFSFLYEAN